jgi:predicted DNA-binding transcriptional regulator AlpA
MTHPARPQDRAIDSTDQRPTDNADLLTIAEAAAIVRAPVATLRYWRHLGTGPRSFRVGRGVRYWRTDVTAWLEQQRSREATTPGR